MFICRCIRTLMTAKLFCLFVNSTNPIRLNVQKHTLRLRGQIHPHPKYRSKTIKMGHFSPQIMFFDKIKHFYKIKNRQIWIFRKSNFQNRKIKIFGRKSENLVEKSTFFENG